jgi:hypothetical protein
MRDITGLRTGRLVAVEPHHTDGRGWFWVARCDCGIEKIVRADKLVGGVLKSCGCGPRRGGDSTGRRKWGLATAANPTYRSWAAMINRCTNAKIEKAVRYYQRPGVGVCARWLSFAAFVADMGERPGGTSLDRYPDPYGDYEPGNCRWATPKEQRSNQRKRGTF